jgi:hypothetical protein
MRAQVGDKLVVQGRRLGQHGREGEVIEVHGPDGTPPYIVRWSDTEQEGLVFPGSDTTVQHFERHA